MDFEHDHDEQVAVRQPFQPRDIDREVAANIRRLRELKGLTQAQLAKASGLTHRSVHRYETLQRAISVQDLDRIEEILGPCRTDRVPSPAEHPSRGEAMRPDERRLLGIYRELDEEGRHILLGKGLVLLDERAKDQGELASTNEAPFGGLLLSGDQKRKGDS